MSIALMKKSLQQRETTKKTILLVDDMEEILIPTKKMLEAEGYSVIMANQGDAGIQVVNARDGKIDLIITDLVMPPGIDGLQMSKEIHQEFPHIPIILYSGTIPLCDFSGIGIKKCLGKSCPSEILLNNIKKLLKK